MNFKVKENNEHSWTIRNRVATLIAGVIIGTIFLVCLAMIKVRIDEYAGYTLKSQIQMATVSINAQLNDAKRSIVAAANDVGAEWRDGGHFDPVEIVEGIQDKYSFDVLEFVNAEGINLMSGANRFDASDREYYKEGIKGKSGLWINYSPKESNEYLLDYYAPVYHQGQIVGVLVGALGSKSSLEPLTQSEFFGRDSIGVIYSKDERAIAGSFGVEGETYASDIYDMFNLTEEDKRIFSVHVKNKDEVVFEYEGEKGKGIACTADIEGYDWGLVIIIPSVTFSSVYGDFTNTEVMCLGAIVTIVCIYILYILGINNRRYTRQIKENEDIIQGFSKVYHSVYMLDFNEGTASCLRTRDPMATKYGITPGKTVSIKDELLKYLVAIADKNGAETLSSLDNAMFIKTMLDGREYFSIEFNQMSGGTGSVAIADMKLDSVGINEDNKEKSEGLTEGRYLMGITELG